MVGADPSTSAPRARRRKLLLAGGAGALVTLAGIAAVVLLLRGDSGDAPDRTAARYLAAWEADDIATLQSLVAEPPASFPDEHKRFRDTLGIEATTFDLGDVSTQDGEAIAPFTAHVQVGGLGEWTYKGRLRLQRTGEDDAWRVAWTPATIHPGQTDGRRLDLVQEWPERGEITGAGGAPLAAAEPGQLIGIEPQRMEDRARVKRALRRHLDVDPATVDAALDAPGVEPHHLVPIATVTNERFKAVRPDIYPVPGLVFRERPVRASPTRDFARHVVGETGEITAEGLDELGSPYQIGDIVGRSGLERRFERELAGTPNGEIRLVDQGGQAVEAIHQFEGTEPVDVRTTLDPAVQQTVDTALDGLDRPAAAAVVDREGNIRALASRPLDEFNRALTGRYPPGSTFKVVTTDALLASGITPDTRIPCRSSIVAGGREITNFEDTALGEIPFRKAFAQSCNTAFVGATQDLPAGELVAAAERFGFNTSYTVGLDTATSDVPEPGDGAEKAAASIGQARILATPLHMATVAATVNSGTWHPPTLLPDLEPPDGESPPEPRELDSDRRATLQALMERVVREGSGEQAGVPGATVAGKTGTAEFGEGDPLPTHAWFIGFRGDLALALVIEDGGVGGRDAAPVAGRIFAALPG